MLTWLLSLILSFLSTTPTSPSTPPKPDTAVFQTEIQGISNTGKPGEKSIIIEDILMN